MIPGAGALTCVGLCPDSRETKYAGRSLTAARAANGLGSEGKFQHFLHSAREYLFLATVCDFQLETTY